MRYLTILLFVLFLPHFVRGQDLNWDNSLFRQHLMWNANNISGWIDWNGLSGKNPYSGEAGIYFPRFTAPVVFRDGLVWGGYVRDGMSPALRVGGQTYRTSTVPGWINPDGTPRSVDDSRVRIYRIANEQYLYSVDTLRMDGAELLNREPGELSASQLHQLRDLYSLHKKRWPGKVGAPYIDHNFTNHYESGADEAQFLDETQTLWLVTNDQNPAVTSRFYGSPPMGLETQITVFGYNRAEPFLAGTSFRKYRLINKSGFSIDSMYLAIWADVQIGNGNDDLVGCDSTLGLAYGYNATAYDSVFNSAGLPPAAVGYLLVQGPIVPSPGDTAYFNFRRVLNYRNLPVHSFGYRSRNEAIPEPQLGHYNGTLSWYNWLQGFWPIADIGVHHPYVHGSGVFAGRPTLFPLNGDPYQGIGDVDGSGNNFAPGDRQMVMSIGPFSMQPGDTQEVVIAVIGAIDPYGNHLSAVQLLRQYATQILDWKDSLYIRPRMHFTSLSGPYLTEFTVQADLRDYPGTTECMLTFMENGNIWLNFPLYDDGNHQDELAGDGIWGNYQTIQNRNHFGYAAMEFVQNGITHQYHNALVGVPLSPAPGLKNPRIVWENGPQNHAIEAGEKVHIAFDILNSSYTHYIHYLQLQDNDVENAPEGLYVLPGGLLHDDRAYVVHRASRVGNTTTLEVRLDCNFGTFYYPMQLPTNQWLPGNQWQQPLPVESIRGVTYNIRPILVDPEQLTGHDYLITFSKYVSQYQDALVWNLYDMTTGECKLSSQAPAHDFQEDMPVVDGIEWKITYPPPSLKAIVQVANRLGPLPPEEWDEAGAPFQGNNVWHDPSASTDLNPFMLSAGGGNGELERLLRSLHNARDHDFEIRFTNAGGIYLWWYSDHTYAQVPFEAWDVGLGTFDDPGDDVRCITGGYSGNSQTGPNGFNFDYTDPFSGLPATDWIYLRVPNDSLGTYQIFENDVLSGALTYDWWEHTREVLARIIFCDYSGNNTLPETGTIIRFILTKRNYPGDSLLVHTDSLRAALGLVNSVRSFELYQNYPNPFNPTTTLRFQLATPVHVKLEIFNVLGQKVRTLVDAPLPAGEHKVVWNGRNDADHPLGSGLYFYRLTAGDFIKIRKMVLIR